MKQLRSNNKEVYRSRGMQYVLFLFSFCFTNGTETFDENLIYKFLFTQENRWSYSSG